MTITNERKGELIITVTSFLFALFPLILSGSRDILPPILFLGLTLLISGVFFLGIHFRQLPGLWSRLRAGKRHLLWGFFFFSATYLPAMFFLGQYIEPGNMSILFQAEILFAFLFFVVLLGHEPFLFRHTGGMLLVVIGTALVLWQHAHLGKTLLFELLFMAVMLLGSIAAYHEKEALRYMQPLDYLLVQRFLGALLFLPMGLFLSAGGLPVLTETKPLLLLLLSGILSFGVAEWLWLLSLKYIGVSKATTITGSTPAITFLYLFFLGTVPSWEQVLGVLLTFFGIYLLFEKKEKRYEGVLVSGEGRGKTLGFPTINLEMEKPPPKGVFLVEVFLNIKNPPSPPSQGGTSLYALLHHGKNKTFGAEKPTVEIHLLNFDEELKKGVVVEFQLLQKIRGTKKFADAEELQKAIEHDMMQAEQYLSRGSLSPSSENLKSSAK